MVNLKFSLNLKTIIIKLKIQLYSHEKFNTIKLTIFFIFKLIASKVINTNT